MRSIFIICKYNQKNHLFFEKLADSEFIFYHKIAKIDKKIHLSPCSSPPLIKFYRTCRINLMAEN